MSIEPHLWRKRKAMEDRILMQHCSTLSSRFCSSYNSASVYTILSENAHISKAKLIIVTNSCCEEDI